MILTHDEIEKVIQFLNVEMSSIIDTNISEMNIAQVRCLVEDANAMEKVIFYLIRGNRTS